MKLLLFLAMIFSAIVPAAATPTIAQVIISTGNDSLKASGSDTIASQAKSGNDSEPVQKERGTPLWKWSVALSIFMLIAILIMIIRAKK